MNDKGCNQSWMTQLRSAESRPTHSVTEERKMNYEKRCSESNDTDALTDFEMIQFVNIITRIFLHFRSRSQKKNLFSNFQI